MAGKRLRNEQAAGDQRSPKKAKKQQSLVSRIWTNTIGKVVENVFVLPFARTFVIPKLARQALLPHDQAGSGAPGKPLTLEQLRPFLRDKAEIYRDSYGVPHIYASNEADLFFLNGVVQAEDRLFQMELMRRLVSGTLSEFAGEKAIETDKFSRTMGWSRLSRVGVERLLVSASVGDSESKNILDKLQMYCNGVNEVIADLKGKRKLPFEIVLLGIEVSPWSIADVIGILYLVCFKMSFGFQAPILRQYLSQVLGHDIVKKWFGESWPECPPIVSIPKQTLSSSFLPNLFEGPATAQGSNCWCVSDKYTADGLGPLLANDPHLEVSLPGFFYEVHLSGEDLNVSGMSVPGFPGMVLPGHNEEVAWGVTLAMGDVEDVYIEKFVGKPNSILGFPKTYVYGDRILEVESFNHTINVKGAEPVNYVSANTLHGPIISHLGYKIQDGIDNLLHQAKSLWPEATYELSFAARHLSTDVVKNIGIFFGVGKAKSVRDAQKTLSKLVSPSLNICLIDKSNIGYQLCGEVPVRSTPRKSELLPLCGWTAQADWRGVITEEKLPSSFNPPAGKIVTANNKIVDYEEYPYYLGSIWQDGYRAKEIISCLQKKERFKIRDFEEIQACVHSEAALEFASHFHHLRFDDKYVKDAVDKMRRWNGKLSKHSVGACVYKVIFTFFIHNLFQKVLRVSTFEKEEQESIEGVLSGHGFNPVLKVFNEFKGMLHGKALDYLRNNCGSKEEKQELIRISSKQAVDWLRAKLGSDMHTWEWGKIHKMKMLHSLSEKLNMPDLETEFPFEGDATTPMMAGHDYTLTAGEPNFDVVKGSGGSAACRLVMHSQNWDQSTSILSGGQSGKWLSKHYKDQVHLFQKYKSKPMLWSKKKVQAAAVYKATQIPIHSQQSK